MTDRNRAALFFEPGKPFEVREFPVPDPRPGGLTLKITRANICGSELHIWRGDGRFAQVITPNGRILGHEATGVVHALGDGVTHDWNGARIHEATSKPGMEQPIKYWVPSIAPSGMAFYDGKLMPAWKGNVFVGGMQRGEITNTGRLERVVFNDKMEELRRESLLTELFQRIRDVRQGPDGFLYVLTEEQDGALLRIEPAP